MAASNHRSSRSANVRRTSDKQRRRSATDVLEVSVRTRHALRLKKEKFLGLTTRLVLVLAVVAALYFGGRKLASSLLLHNPDYNVAELNVQTDGKLTREVVLESADIQRGSNIFFVNLDRAKSRLEAMPQVEHAQVSKQLPNRITIQINERKPVAWVAPEHTLAGREEIVASPAAHLVDAHGVLLPPSGAQPQDRYLPIIRNYSGGPRADGQEVDGEEIRAALDLIRAQQDSLVAARFQIQEIDLAKHFGLEVKDRNGLQVLFGLDDMERQLRRLRDDLLVLDESPAKPQTINLLVQKNVPVTFVTEPVATAQTLSPSPSPASTPLAAGGKTNAVASKPKSVTSSKDGSKKHQTVAKTSVKSVGSEHRTTKRGPQPFNDAH